MARKTKSATKPKRSSAQKPRREAVATRQTKPVFRTGTWIAVLLLAVLIGGAYYLNNKKNTAEAEATPSGEAAAFVFPEESAVSGIEVKPMDGETVKLARNAENAWAMELPLETEADQGLVEAAASQVTALKIIDEVDGDPSIFGFDSPAYVIAIEFADGTSQSLEVGDATPTNSGYYVRLDKKKMMIVGLSSIDALTNLASSPPYLNTPTPTALPSTPTPESPTEAAITPQATVTPTP